MAAAPAERGACLPAEEGAARWVRPAEGAERAVLPEVRAAAEEQPVQPEEQAAAEVRLQRPVPAVAVGPKQRTVQQAGLVQSGPQGRRPGPLHQLKGRQSQGHPRASHSPCGRNARRRWAR